MSYLTVIRSHDRKVAINYYYYYYYRPALALAAITRLTVGTQRLTSDERPSDLGGRRSEPDVFDDIPFPVSTISGSCHIVLFPPDLRTQTAVLVRSDSVYFCPKIVVE